MPSVFTHSLIGVAVGLAASPRPASWRTWTALALLPVIPDLDVPMQSMLPPETRWQGSWSHRGFSHSLIFAAAVAVAVSFLLQKSERGWARRLLLAAAMASHGALDAFTNGGEGIEFLWPFSERRTHWPVRPIEVASLRAADFFTEDGWRVLQSEMLWVWTPAAAALILVFLLRRASAPAVH